MRTLARLQGVSKVYPRVHHSRERLRAFASLLAGREPKDGATVLSDVDLEVRQGESLGIIGENGAGKSTLLKILTGVIQPTRGTVSVNARVAALLELGAGFQPDFSGLDNVRMKASLLGMGRQDLDDRLDEILGFADIGEYIHEPVKHYSSGMVVRLGFAVVAASRPELLITDEVLAVGDESFQKKCVKWIDGFLDDGGTLMLVSHSMYLVQKLCRHAMWIRGGRVQAWGESYPVTQDYLAWHETRNQVEDTAREAISGDDGHYRVQHLLLGDEQVDQRRGVLEDEVFEHPVGTDLAIELLVRSPDGRAPIGMLGIVRADGASVYGVSSETAGVEPESLGNGRYRFRVRFPALPLLPGRYQLRGHVLDPEGLRVCDTLERILRVTGNCEELGMVRLAHEWQGAE